MLATLANKQATQASTLVTLVSTLATLGYKPVKLANMQATLVSLCAR